MTLFHALILGIVEGLTEFLPISSTFHLILTAKFLGIPQDDFAKFFEVFIQAGAILPLVVMFARELLKDRRLLIQVIVGSIPAATIGLVLHKVIKSVFFSADWLMVIMFIAVGLLFILMEWLVKQQKLRLEKELHQYSMVESVKIGLFQALAVVPGVSRSGSMMLGGMLMGMTRTAAAKYAFLLAIPTILGASALDLVKSREMLMTLSDQQWLAIAVGFVSAMIVGWLSINWFLKFVRQNSLAWFGWYRVTAGVLLLAWMVIS